MCWTAFTMQCSWALILSRYVCALHDACIDLPYLWRMEGASQHVLCDVFNSSRAGLIGTQALQSCACDPYDGGAVVPVGMSISNDSHCHFLVI